MPLGQRRHRTSSLRVRGLQRHRHGGLAITFVQIKTAYNFDARSVEDHLLKRVHVVLMPHLGVHAADLHLRRHFVVQTLCNQCRILMLMIRSPADYRFENVLEVTVKSYFAIDGYSQIAPGAMRWTEI